MIPFYTLVWYVYHNIIQILTTKCARSNVENRQSSATLMDVKFILNRLSKKEIIVFRTRRLASLVFDQDSGFDVNRTYSCVGFAPTSLLNTTLVSWVFLVFCGQVRTWLSVLNMRVSRV